jgi:hypothetical protein
VRIAGADSGVVPYVTGAAWLDLAGLNDGFIARERDLRRLVDYVFAWEPDLVFHPATTRPEWIDFGHGPLGDYRRWADDPRWDRYLYAGTWRHTQLYDYHLLVRRDGPRSRELLAHLRGQVVDGTFEYLPVALGTWRPPPGPAPRWQERPFSMP